MRPVFYAVIAASIAVPVFAQRWTPEQTQVIDQLKECWAVWEAALAAGDPTPWLDRCATDDVTYWRGGSLGGVVNERGSWETWMQLEYRWVDLQPLAVKVNGNMAVIQFYGYWSENRSACVRAGATAEFRVRQEAQRAAGVRMGVPLQ